MDLAKEELIIEERKKKALNYIKHNPNLIFILLLVAFLILGFYIRYLPLTDHGGKPGLWDNTLNDYTLGPDLDPFLFLRYAKTIIETGSLPQMDNLRNVPLGFDTTTELQMVSYMIVLTYKLINLFGNYSLNYAAAFMPVIFFLLTIISFFLFVREIFVRKEMESKIKAGIIASISTLFMIIIPAFLSRTVAGIPEKESVAFFFMFLSFFLFLKSWKSEKTISALIFGVLAGISTGLMGLTWGGVTIVYITIALTMLSAFFLNKINKNELLIYAAWLISSMIILFTMTNRFDIKGFIFGIDTGLSCLVFGIILGHHLIWNTQIKKILNLERIKIPKTVISAIIIILIGLIISIILNPHFVISIFNQVQSRLIKPITGRWSTTVAENRQPYFTEWFGSFGKPVFWMFVLGSIWLFYNMFNKLDKKDRIIMTLSYILLLFGIIFSRYAPHPSILDGENIISKFVYFGSVILFIIVTLKLYIKYYQNNDFAFEKIEFEYLLLFILFFITIASARGAVRLIMVLVPIAPIMMSYLLTDLGFRIYHHKNNRLLLSIILIILIFYACFSGMGYYKSIKIESNSYVPSGYTIQWQNAMSWVRSNTPVNSVFAHWWDYGYWVQSIGNRATVTDGGNNIVWWNYLTGRYVLTGNNQKDSLEVLWNHNVTHLLIDSSDIGKYGAFSQIGSDENFDRLSSGPITIPLDIKQTKETKNGIMRIYSSGSGYGLEEDIVQEINGTKLTLFKENSGLIGISLTYQDNNGTYAFQQPNAWFVSQGEQISLPLRYAYYNKTLIDFKTGIEATAYFIPKLDNAADGTLSMDNLGAVIYLSPRIQRGLLGQLYILDNALGNFNNYELVHSENDYVLSYLQAQGVNLNEFIYYGGLRGPIKIWKIKYTGSEKPNVEYVQKKVPSYISWKF